MEESYARFCTVARGAEVLCAQWALLVARELLCGRSDSAICIAACRALPKFRMRYIGTSRL
jgi:hypothetical protein